LTKEFQVGICKKEIYLKTRRLGGTDLSLTTVGIGTWPMAGAGGGGWGHKMTRTP